MLIQSLAKVTLGDLLPAGLTIVVLAVTLAIGAKVLNDVDDSFVANSSSDNISQEGKAGLLDFAEQLPLIATVIALSAVLFIVVRLIQ